MNMIDFNKTFGQSSSNGQSNSERENAQVWMNVGYSVEVQTGENDKGKPITETRFVSLPVGVPIDTQKPIDIRSSNEQFRNFQGARNNLLEQIQQAAANLKPGEEKMLNLEIQLRRVNEPSAAPATDETNLFARKLDL